jgi:DNA repair protein RecO (recombination protein O)
VLLPGNFVLAEYRARTDEQLAALTVELIHSRAPLFAEALPAAAIGWTVALTAAALPDGQPYPQLYQALSGVIGAIEAAPSAKGWAAPLVRYELLVLAELGFGLDLSQCAATGTSDDLRYVSPKSGRAVSEAGAAEYRDRLLALPAFLATGGRPTGRTFWPASASPATSLPAICRSPDYPICSRHATGCSTGCGG